ncbi:hypothetical protein, partial [Paraburkholderia sp. BR14264]|uniref:hypothetical protein n=1 Tax=Paraburkholderia sp. BR14264 TaxID=3237001 RepID=UPI00397B8C5D
LRSLHVIATVLLAVGFTGLGVAMWSLFLTVDGGGANIGAGILALFAYAVGGVGLVLLAVTGVVAGVARARGRLMA